MRTKKITSFERREEWTKKREKKKLLLLQAKDVGVSTIASKKHLVSILVFAGAFFVYLSWRNTVVVASIHVSYAATNRSSEATAIERRLDEMP